MINVAMLFPGGGTQYIGMGKVFYNNFAVVRQVFEEANDTLGYDLKHLCFEGPMDQLSAMTYSQPAIFTASLANSWVYDQEVGISPTFVAGHSLGEYTALTYAGVLTFTDAIKIVRKRGELLHQAGVENSGTMIAVNKLGTPVLEEECRELRATGSSVYIAVYNSLYQHVVAGKIADIEALVNRLNRFRSIEVKYLNISTPSHCPLLRDAAVALREELEKYQYNPLMNPVVSNLTGRPYPDSRSLIDALTAHMTEPVQWHGTMSFLKENKVGCFVDMGPQAVLKNLTAFIAPHVPAYSFDSPEAPKSIKTAVQSDLDTDRSFIRKCLAVAVSTRNYNYDENSYCAEVITPYRELAAMHEQTRHQPPTGEQMADAYRLLNGILAGKRVPRQISQPTLDAAFGATWNLANGKEPAA